MHRCMYGDVLLEVFVGKVNSDQTEGRGSMRDFSFHTNAKDALESVMGQGVMGVGNGDVYRRVFYSCNTDKGDSCTKILTTEEQIYNDWARTRNGSRDFGPDGWKAQFSPLLNDPEYKDYLRLKEKFENG